MTILKINNHSEAPKFVAIPRECKAQKLTPE